MANKKVAKWIVDVKDRVVNKKSGVVHIKGIYQKHHRAHCGAESILFIKATDDAPVTCNRCRQYISEEVAKWRVEFKEEVLKYDDDKDEHYTVDFDAITDAGIENEEYEISVEISAIREDNKHGHRSWGWGDSDKIILFDGGADIESKANIDWMLKVAQTTVDALNKVGL